MLLLRVLTASVFAPMVIFSIINLNGIGFSIVLIVVFSVALWELSSLLKIKSLILKFNYVLFIVFTTFFLSKIPSTLMPVLIASLFWWIIAFYWVITFPKSSKHILESNIVKLASGAFLFVPMSLSLITLHINNSSLVLLLFGLIWASDIGAYFSGKIFGKTKLSPNVSPKKTVEGLIGGVVLSIIIAVSYVIIIKDNSSLNDYLMFGFLSITVSLFSVLGDLFESLLKRLAKVKDSGKILPGHGGIMDRIDSLTSAAPVFFLLYIYVL